MIVGFPPLYYRKTLIVFTWRLCRKPLAFANHQSFMIDNIMIFRSAAEKNPPSLSIVLCPLKKVLRIISKLRIKVI